MKAILLISLIGFVASQQYVWDLLKPALNAAEVQAILANRDQNQYPTLAAIPASAQNFDCSAKKQPGFYADVSTQCQVFHRCDINGNHTSYLCLNMTVFNQITLVCDYFFNVDCEKSPQVEDFANSRLYTDKPLFDTPPADYVPPGVGAPQIMAAQPAQKKAAPKPKAAAGKKGFI
ncbi:uncharacterized protein LOC129601004 [Paramacrobiotus metropolitanus]|uniref:uncharacterized protein LOC129601004 n=1 Tax=Paramacrobiotus metropolitanus TaxID=2943436 RepID=UPI002445A878|nr:uncharacterized protein LOC129601004 [Paramacrobiotus metropolitanus]